MHLAKWWQKAGLAGILAVSTGCASVSVRRAHPSPAAEPRQAPSKIIVQPFEVGGPGIRVDRSGAALEDFQKQTGEALGRRLAETIARDFYPAEFLPADARISRGNAWLVSGRVTRIHQGSRFLRAVVGMGAGATRMETTSWVSRLDTQPPRRFYYIETSGGSNISPGVLGSAAYFVGGITSLISLANAVEGVRTGVSFDTARTAREIAAAISEYMVARGWIEAGRGTAPKRPGQWALHLGPLRPRPGPPPQPRPAP